MDNEQLTRIGPISLHSPNGHGEIMLDVYEEEGRMICGVYRLDAKLERNGWLRNMRAEMAKLEQVAKDAGCVEMRLGGRDWSRVFPGYEFLMGVKNGLRKAL